LQSSQNGDRRRLASVHWRHLARKPLLAFPSRSHRLVGSQGSQDRMHHQTSPKSLQRGRRINPQLLQSVRLPLQFFRQVKGCGIQTCTAVVCLAILRTNVDNHSCLLGVQESLMGLHMPCHAMQQWPNTSCWRVTAQQGPGSQGMKTCVACQADTCRQSLPFVRALSLSFPSVPLVHAGGKRVVRIGTQHWPLYSTTRQKKEPAVCEVDNDHSKQKRPGCVEAH